MSAVGADLAAIIVEVDNADPLLEWDRLSARVVEFSTSATRTRDRAVRVHVVDEDAVAVSIIRRGGSDGQDAMFSNLPASVIAAAVRAMLEHAAAR